MDKKALSVIARQQATDEMIETANRLDGMKFIATAERVEDGNILMMHIYKISNLKKGSRTAEFRTFFSNNDYINQKLDTDKVRWFTASLSMMDGFNYFDGRWDYNRQVYIRKELVYIRSKKEKDLICRFFKQYTKKDDKYTPWTSIYRFQEEVKAKRLEIKHKKETDPIDRLMETVTDAPEDFFDWVWNEAMSFSRYLIYSPIGKKAAECVCTCCKKYMIVDRNEVRLRNNEKGICPNCGKNVTVKAKGKMPTYIHDSRWVVYIDTRDDGFIWRYYHVFRKIYKSLPSKVEEGTYERVRSFYTFKEGQPVADIYEYADYKQTGKTRWCHDNDRIPCGLCVLYPGNLPHAWEHTPMKYSALEILAKNIPTQALHYEWGITRFMEFPALEWMIKMGLNQIAEFVINENPVYTGYSRWLNLKAKTIFNILKLNKINTRILQRIDGCPEELRLLQVSEQVGIQFKPEQLREYYETFGCNTELLKKTKRKASLHKLLKYIANESEAYPLGDYSRYCRYSFNRYKNKEDPRTVRKQNMARDWIEYLGWCKELKYDLDNMFIYMPKNFKKVHDRISLEYQALQDERAKAERKREERRAKLRMKKTKAALSEILEANKNTTDAFSLQGKGLVLVVPKSAEDIKAEGTALHHCVGSYVKRVAEGRTMILFIRKKETPEKSYYTMEWRDNKVQQCRGLNNCGMTPEVLAFTKAFEKIMTQKMQKQILAAAT